ncbi:PREDICTED: quinone oxidoreductase PIG3-like [Fragaria vesca subsp. vesca]
MQAVVVRGEGGGPETLQVQTVPRPIPKQDEVLVKVDYAGVNRPDIHQREDMLPPDDRRSHYLGLECSGSITEFGVGMSNEDKKAWKLGDKVCAITNGGSYAEYVAVPVGHLLPIPSSTNLQDAATFPQAACTVSSELFMKERLSLRMVSEEPGSRLSSGENQTLLIHGGSSGIGTFAIQMAKHQGVTVYVTAGSDEKLKVCEKLGADFCINYHKEEFEKEVLKKTAGKGVNVILDCLGDKYFLRNISCLSSGGWLVTIGPTCNTSVQDSYTFPSERHQVEACSLRNRTSEDKAEIVEEVKKHVWPAIEAGKVKAYENNIKPYPFKHAADAHKRMENGNFIGKILLSP